MHGTSTKLIDGISRKGLRASRGYIPERDGVFLTDDLEVVEQSASVKSDEAGGDPAVCDVEADTSWLTPDRNMYDLPTYGALARASCDTGDLEESERCWKAKLRSGEVPLPKNSRDWKTSLRTVNAVISMKPIPASKIKCRRL